MSLLLSFEGTEGAGKSTQIARLAARLAARGIKATLTREPGGTALGEKIRELLLDRNAQIEPLAECLLYAASRRQLVTDYIFPALERNEIVICDRYIDSTLAYQGYGRGLSLDLLQDLMNTVTDGQKPHLTFLLDIDPEQGLTRVVKRGEADRIEASGLAFHRRVREGFLALAAAEKERFVVLDATLDPDALEDRIWQRVERILQENDI